MEYSDFLNGYMKSGGWRFGGKPTSTDTFKSLYTPEAYNGGLLDKVGNANKGPVTSAVTASPVSTAVTTGLLANRDGGRDTPEPSGWDKMTPTEKAAYYADNPTMAKITQLGQQAFSFLNPLGLATLQAKLDPSLVKEAALIAQGIDPLGPMGYGTGGGSFAGMGVSPNAGMSLSDQYSQYGAGRVAAENTIAGSGLLGGGYQSAPAAPAVSLSPSQTQAMIDSLTNAGYYSGGGGYSGGYSGNNGSDSYGGSYGGDSYGDSSQGNWG